MVRSGRGSLFTRRRLLTVAISALLLVLLAAGSALWLTWRLPFRSGGFFDEVSNSYLAAEGIVLTWPGLFDWPGTSSASVEQTALGVAPSEIRRTVFLHVHFGQPSHPDCLCWVISMWTPGGVARSSGPPPGSGPGRLKFRLAFAQADNGKFVLMVEEGTRT
jgi:hypothetical protein